jgi:hypothetical protein
MEISTNITTVCFSSEIFVPVGLGVIGAAIRFLYLCTNFYSLGQPAEGLSGRNMSSK